MTGEALIDFVPRTTPDGLMFRPCCGGSPYNAAKAAARQGAKVSFIGPVSTDLFGDMLAADLVNEGVGLTHAPRVDKPTTLAFVTYDGTDARYAFFDNGSAMRLSPQGDIAAVLAKGDIVHAGSISLINDPGGTGIVDTLVSAAGRAMLSLDPNARPGMIRDIAAWRARMDGLINHAGVVKLSDEDLAVLAPDATPEDYIADLIGRGVALAVVTLGARGAIAATAEGRATVEVRHGGIVDTVGAGDTVTGTLLSQIAHLGLAAPDALKRAGDDRLGAMLSRAMAAASLNCEKPGCDPPTRQEIDAVIDP